MDKSEYRKKQDDAEHKRQEAAKGSYRQQVVGSLERIAAQTQATENQAHRADTFHRRVEKLTLRLEGRKFWLELAETVGLWVAAAVGVIAIIVSSHDSDRQRTVMEAQQVAMQGQLDEMRATESQTNEMIETNRKLAEAAGKQAQAAIDSAKTAQENMVASQRAWVGPRNAKSATGPELEKNLDIVVEYQNTGREPALETIVDSELFVATKEEDDSGAVTNRVNDFTAKCRIKWDPTKKGVVFPSGNTSSAYELTRTLDADEIDQEVLDGSKTIILDGCFVYKSAGGIRRSSFCYFFTSKKTKPTNWGICAVGNDAD
jgi:hypothetical protein